MIRTRYQTLTSKVPESVEEVREIIVENRGLGRDFFDTDLLRLKEYRDSISGMNDAARLVANHMARENKIVLVGDYDCDGVTSLSQMALFLRECGFENFVSIIPDRFVDGYGMPERAIAENPDASLFICMDCGTLDTPAHNACEQGYDLIVMDHHEIADISRVTPASAIVNPKHPDCPSTFKEFCSAGLTYLFLTALRSHMPAGFENPRIGTLFLSLAAVGTIADLVPLQGGNRILAQQGLMALNHRKDRPFQYLLNQAGIRKQIRAGTVGFQIGPRINASGRMKTADTAYRLFVTEDEEEMQACSEFLNQMNNQRKKDERAILDQIREMFDQGAFDGRRTIVVAGENWSSGIVGVCASKVQESLHYGPVIVMERMPEKGTAKGSARSVDGFNIHAALKECEDLLDKWGGHEMAAGLELKLENLDEFCQRFEMVASHVDNDVFVRKVKVDSQLDFSLITSELYRVLEQFAPHGVKNPSPLFCAREAKVVSVRKFGANNQFVELRLQQGDTVLPAVHWAADGIVKVGPSDTCDVVFRVEWDNYLGSPTMEIQDYGPGILSSQEVDNEAKEDAPRMLPHKSASKKNEAGTPMRSRVGKKSESRLQLPYVVI